MNKEQQQIIDEAYKEYHKNWWEPKPVNNSSMSWMEQELVNDRALPKQWFIDECKTDTEFSEKWGLKIEERELSLEEKEWQLEKTNCINDIENDRIIYGHEWKKYIQEQYEGIQSNQGIKIPAKLITITYNNKTIESYEN